jgi:NTE family protein
MALKDATAKRQPAAQAHTKTPPRDPSKFRLHKAEKTIENEKQSEDDSRTALVLGGGAPNMALMAGALAALHQRGITFDVVSCSGAGSLAGLLWLAPKGGAPAEALRSVTTMSIVDPIYQYWCPVNYKVFHKPGYWADLWGRAIAANPLFKLDAKLYERCPFYAAGIDLMLLWAATMTPSELQYGSWGLCQPTPFIEQIIDFERIKKIKPYFYLNAYNVTKQIIDNFPKDKITPDHFHAALAFPFIYGPYPLNGNLYYEGAVVDCLNFKDLVERHRGLETIVVFDVLGTDTLIRAPRNLYDSWVLSMIIPLVKTAEDNLDLFALKHNNGWQRDQGALTDLLKITFDIPKEYQVEALDWSASNASRLFEIGYKSGLSFCDVHAGQLGGERVCV